MGESMVAENGGKWSPKNDNHKKTYSDGLPRVDGIAHPWTESLSGITMELDRSHNYLGGFIWKLTDGEFTYVARIG